MCQDIKFVSKDTVIATYEDIISNEMDVFPFNFNLRKYFAVDILIVCVIVVIFNINFDGNSHKKHTVSDKFSSLAR